MGRFVLGSLVSTFCGCFSLREGRNLGYLVGYGKSLCNGDVFCGGRPLLRIGSFPKKSSRDDEGSGPLMVSFFGESGCDFWPVAHSRIHRDGSE